MPGLVPGIHVFCAMNKKDVDGRAQASGSDAVLRTAMPGGDDLSKLKEKPKMNRTKPPFRADHVGKNVPTSREEQVRVQLEETDGTDGVEIARIPEPVPAAEPVA